MDLINGSKLNRLEGVKSIHILQGEGLNLFQKVAGKILRLTGSE